MKPLEDNKSPTIDNNFSVMLKEDIETLANLFTPLIGRFSSLELLLDVV